MNKYIPVEYEDDVDDGVLDYLHFGHPVFHPTIRWADRARADLIEFNSIINNVKIDTGLTIGKGVSRSSHTELKEHNDQILGFILRSWGASHYFRLQVCY